MNSRAWIALGTTVLATACSPKPAQEAPAVAPAQTTSMPERPVPATSSADGSASPPEAARPGCTSHFEAFDTNADQRVSLEEFLAGAHANPDPNAVFRSRDGDGDGSLTALEFCSRAGEGHGQGAGMGMGHGAGMGTAHGAGPRCEANFTRFDANGDGQVSEQEFLAQPHAHADPHAIFAARDENKDGQLILAEFCTRSNPAGQAPTAAAP